MALEREEEHHVASPAAIAHPPPGGIRERWAYLTQPRVTFAVLGECLWAALSVSLTSSIDTCVRTGICRTSPVWALIFHWGGKACKYQ